MIVIPIYFESWLGQLTDKVFNPWNQSLQILNHLTLLVLIYFQFFAQVFCNITSLSPEFFICKQHPPFQLCFERIMRKNGKPVNSHLVDSACNLKPGPAFLCEENTWWQKYQRKIRSPVVSYHQGATSPAAPKHYRLPGCRANYTRRSLGINLQPTLMLTVLGSKFTASGI